MLRKITLLFFIVLALGKLQAQEYGIYMIRNCQQEMRTATFHPPFRFFWWWTFGNTSFKEQRVLNFATSYQVDTLQLYKQIEKLRNLLPAVYKKPEKLNVGQYFNNVPDEKAIWFTNVFAQKDSKGKYTVFGAYKVIFEGSNAHNDAERREARIKDVIFIFDKKELLVLGELLPHLPQPM